MFDRLVQEALDGPVEGWDFSWIRDRWHEDKPPWDYRAIVESYLPEATALLDMGTGGGEFLSSLKPLPDFTAATEGWLPNVPVATQRLAALGITVKHYKDDHHLPFEDETFDLVINRHESFAAAEIHRIMQDGGIFITQQVADNDNIELNVALDAPLSKEENALLSAVREFSQAGFVILRAEEASLLTEFYDIGAVVYYLKIITWQIPDFDVNTYRDHLLKLHEHIEREGKFVCHNRRFLLVARKEAV